MSYAPDYALPASEAPASERAAFIRRTYGHLAGAVLVLAAIESVLLSLPNIDQIVMGLFGSGPVAWLILMVAFIGAGYLAQSWAQSNTSVGMQYMGLGLYVAVQAVIILPLLWIANTRFPGTIQSAGIMTLAVFGGLSAAVLVTGKDYSFLGPVLAIASILALGLIVCAVIFGLNLGIWFMFGMVALACAFILYDTSNVMHNYAVNQHVAAALALFASVVMLFYWILRVAIASRD